MIRIITNSNGSGDWIRIIDSNDEILHEGHNISAFDLVMILQNLQIHSELVEVNDNQMEEM
jgi:hypothetical protein